MFLTLNYEEPFSGHHVVFFFLVFSTYVVRKFLFLEEENWVAI
jgi:hypothetical protein